MYITVPIGTPFPAATVYHDVAIAPLAVLPYPGLFGLLPQVEAVYADAFKVTTVGVLPSTLAAIEDDEPFALEPDLDIILVDI